MKLTKSVLERVVYYTMIGIIELSIKYDSIINQVLMDHDRILSLPIILGCDRDSPVSQIGQQITRFTRQSRLPYLCA